MQDPADAAGTPVGGAASDGRRSAVQIDALDKELKTERAYYVSLCREDELPEIRPVKMRLD